MDRFPSAAAEEPGSDRLPQLRRVVVASSNRGKLEEIGSLLSGLGIEVLPQSHWDITPPEESGETFLENALIKARCVAAATGIPAIADDSGLAVAALDGRPGVRSARYAGPHADDKQNIDKLLSELKGQANRAASFHCVAVFLPSTLPSAPNSAPLIAHGEWRGRILTERRGQHGFGYDPVFFDPESERSAAELTLFEKNLVSHRGQAMRKLAQLIGKLAGFPQ
ncbi:MAG: RdgB/HAM1 family non-canonical purine NTP pyrophosphatase [Woeseia sp.]